VHVIPGTQELPQRSDQFSIFFVRSRSASLDE
jgi:hypothetical protein